MVPQASQGPMYSSEPELVVMAALGSIGIGMALCAQVRATDIMGLLARPGIVVWEVCKAAFRITAHDTGEVYVGRGFPEFVAFFMRTG